MSTETHKVVTLEQLTTYDQRIKAFINDSIEHSHIAEGLLLETFQHGEDFDITFQDDYHPTDLGDMLSNAKCTGTWDALRWNSISGEVTGDFAFRNRARQLTMNNVTSVGGSGFQNCTALVSVNMPSVTSVGVNGFQNCTALVSVNMPSVTSVGSNGFQNCTALVSVNMPSVTSVGSSGFQNCTALAHADIYSAIAQTATFWYSGSKLRLYDVRMSASLITDNLNMNMWSPTTAVSNTDTSLTARDEWDDHPEGMTFANNREKFLWYFRNRFKPCFTDMSAAATHPTLTLKSTIYDILEQSDFDDWADYGWNLARTA